MYIYVSDRWIEGDGLLNKYMKSSLEGEALQLEYI